jgi:hypothetical protein
MLDIVPNPRGACSRKSKASKNHASANGLVAWRLCRSAARDESRALCSRYCLQGLHASSSDWAAMALRGAPHGACAVLRHVTTTRYPAIPSTKITGPKKRYLSNWLKAGENAQTSKAALCSRPPDHSAARRRPGDDGSNIVMVSWTPSLRPGRVRPLHGGGGRSWT